MATVGNLWRPYESTPPHDRTALKVQSLYTSSSGGATGGAMPIFGSGTAANDFYLTSVNLAISDATAASLVTVLVGTTTVYSLPTGTTGHFPLTFPAPGILGGIVATATVSIGISGGTSTVSFLATGNRKI